MKRYTTLKKTALAFAIAINLQSHAQQEYTLTTTAANITSAKALIDLPGLGGNANAIIIATPVGNTKTLNPHPTGAWYYSGKWNIFNSDYAVMIPGLTYKIKYFLTSGPNQFLHMVTLQNLGNDGSYIDNPALNNKPTAQFEIFQNHSPDTRPGSWLNPNEAKTGYSTAAGKWYITNINGQPLQKGAAYNIVINTGGSISPTDPSGNTTCACPASLPPNGQATGDLSGTYPNPMVTKILGRPLSNTPPQSGQILKWNGTEWAPAADGSGTGNAPAYNAGLGINFNGNSINANTTLPLWNANKLLGIDILTTPPAVGQVLKFGGGSWYPADDNIGPGGNSTAYTAGGGIKVNGTEITALYETPMWNASKLLGRDVSTTTPAVGQVLKWGGAAWAPADDNAGTGETSTNTAKTQGYFRKCGCYPQQSKASLEATHTYIISGLTQDIVTVKNSRVMITFSVEGMNQCISCTPGRIEVTVLDNGVQVPDIYLWFDIPANSRSVHTLSNYMFDVGPGTHKIELSARHFQHTSPILVAGIYSSLLVIPH